MDDWVEELLLSMPPYKRLSSTPVFIQNIYLCSSTYFFSVLSTTLWRTSDQSAASVIVRLFLSEAH